MLITFMVRFVLIASFMNKTGVLALILGLTIGFYADSFATTYYAVCNCNWTGSSTWSTTPGGAGSALPSLNANDILVISNFTVTVDAQITVTPKITINLISNSASTPTVL